MGSQILPTMAQGKLTYNGFEFPPAVKVVATGTPVQDTTGRYTKHVRYIIQVECMLYPGCDDTLLDETKDPPEPTPNSNAIFPESLETLDGIEANPLNFGYEKLRRVLTAQQKEFVFIGKGFGYDFSINTSDGTTEISYGPKPKILRWDSAVRGKAVRLVWSVEVAVADCENKKRFQVGSVAEFSYTSDYSINELGLTTRTISGIVEISQQLSNGASTKSVDFLRDKVQIGIPLTFKRQSQNYRITADQKFLQFTVVDQQIESQIPYHRNLVRSDVKHTVTNVGGLVGGQFIVSLAGTFTVGRGKSKADAWAAFLYYVRHYYNQAINNSKLATSTADKKVTGDRSNRNALPIRMRITDDVTGLTIRAEIAWYVFTTLDSLMRTTGVLNPPDNRSETNWTAWRQSLVSGRSAEWSQRGHAQLTANASQGSPVTLCNAKPIPTIRDNSDNVYLEQNPTIFDPGCPPKENSYISFKHWVTKATNTQSTTSYPTGPEKAYNFEEFTPTIENRVRYERSSLNNELRPVQHSRGPARVQIIYQGSAIRIGHKIPEPTLLEYGGVKITKPPINHSRFSQVPLGLSGNCRVWGARWYQVHQLDDVPTSEEVVTKPNFRLFTPGEQE